MSQPTLDPLAPLVALLGWLTFTFVRLCVGVVLGLVVASAMRRRHLHWTWATSALPFVILARTLFAGWAFTLCVAALCASARGRRWHREDALAGHDIAKVASERHGPLDLLASLAVRAIKRFGLLASTGMNRPRWRAPANDPFRGDRLLVGRERDGQLVSIPLGGPAGGTHTLIVGAAGSGKTVTQTLILTRAVEHGMGAIVLDPKHDARLRRQLELAAHAAGRRFIEWTPTGPSVYNPYAHGSASEIADKALAGERFTEPHYQRQAQRYIGHVVRALSAAEIEISLDVLVRHLDPARLEALARTLPDEHAQRTHEYLDSLTTRQHSDLGGVRDRLAILAESDFAPWLDPDATGAHSFHVLDAVRERAVVYFSLESDTRPLLAHMLGVAIVLDLQTTIAALQSRPVPTVVAIDEFSAIATEQVTRLFARARSAGVSLVLGTQELADLRVPGREAAHDQVLGNLSCLIAHRQVVPASAEIVSKLAGTTGAWRTSQHSDGRSSRTRHTAPVLDPGATANLAPGWAAVLTFGHARSTAVASIFPAGASPVPSPQGGQAR